METYVALNRKYTVEAYLTSVSAPKPRKTLTKYRLCEHNLAAEVGRHRQTWLLREERLCAHCDQMQTLHKQKFLKHSLMSTRQLSSE